MYLLFFFQVYHPLRSHTVFEEVANYIEELPVNDNPDLVGMDANAETAYLELEAETLVATVLSVQPRLSSTLVGCV